MMEKENSVISIRLIGEKDNAVIAAIIRSVLTEFNAAKCGTVYYDPTTDDLYRLFQQNKSAYFIAEKDGKVVAVLFSGLAIANAPSLRPSL